MGLRSVKKFVFISVFLMLLAGCGELDSLFPSRESYQVNVLVNGGSLEDCSLVWANDEIRLHFADSVKNDPDLIGLSVCIQNSKGEIVGDKIQYTLQSYAGEAAQKKAAEEQKEQNPVVIVPIQSFDREIPRFPLPEKMEAGSYSLNIKTVGKKETLYSTETGFFYMDNARFLLRDIAMYLPEVSDTQLIPPGTTILLESNLDFDSRLEPYVIWYNGKSVISEGKIRNGAGALLWKVPDIAGFYSLRVEVLPFHQKGNFTGIFREITLPVTAKAAAGSKGYFFTNGPEYAANNQLAEGTIYPELKRRETTATENTNVPIGQPELIMWYQFEGSLDNTMAGNDAGQSLIPAREGISQWTGTGQSYGLSTGQQDAYLLSPIAFFRNARKDGGGIFLFHVKSLADGTVFSAFFPMKNSEGKGVNMEILRKGNAIVLRLNTDDSVTEIPVYLSPSELETFIPAAVEFYMRPYRRITANELSVRDPGDIYYFEAKMSVGEKKILQSAVVSTMITGTLTGEGKITLGSEASFGEESAAAAYISEKPENYAEEKGVEAAMDIESTMPIIAPDANETNTPVIINAIWNEFAVLYSLLPFFQEPNNAL